MKAVIFDLFETLITEWGRPKYTTREIATDLNIDYELFRCEWSTSRNDRFSGILHEDTFGFNVILNRLGIKRDENLLNEICIKRDESKRKCFEVIEPKIIEMLSSIKEKGYKIGLISNCSADEIKELKNSALYNYFDAVVLSCETGIVKPDEKIYKHCLSVLNEQASDCFYAGDGGSDELNGAKKAGMIPLKALWFTKHFVSDFDSNKDYPALLEPSEINSFLCGYKHCKQSIEQLLQNI